MRKQIKYVVFLLLMFFISINGINALTCKYITDDSKLNAEFTITEKNKNVSVVKLNGTFITSDKSHQDGIKENDKIRNWNKEYKPVASGGFKFETLGLDYYEENEKCPPYGFLVDRNTGLDFLVATDKEHLDSLEVYGKTKQGYAILNLVEPPTDNENNGNNENNENNENNDTLTNASFCNYWSKKAKIGYEFEIDEGRAKGGLLYHKYDNQETVQNWDNAFASFAGKNYYDSNGGRCPGNLIFVKTGTEILLYLSDDSNLESITTKIKETHSNFKDNSPLVLELVTNDDRKIDHGGCSGYNNPRSCKKNEFYSCIWNDSEFGQYCNTDKLVYVKCGKSFDIPYQAPKIISFLITFLKVVIPIVLIFVGILSLLKAVGAANEDEIKKAQKSLVRKIAAAVLAFFVISIVQFVIMKVADSRDIDDISSCLSCFMNNDCDGVAYYKNNVAGNNVCYKLDGTNEEFDCPEYEDLTN